MVVVVVVVVSSLNRFLMKGSVCGNEAKKGGDGREVKWEKKEWGRSEIGKKLLR